MKISRFAKGIALVGFVTVAMTASAVAGHGKGAGKGMGGGRGKGDGKGGAMIEKIVKRLDLTDDQKARIKTIREQFKTTNAPLIAEVKDLHEQAQAARKAGDKERAQQIRAQAQPKMEQLKTAREQMMQQVLAVLTPEQRAELEKMRDERKEKRGDRKEKRKHKGGGRSTQGEQSID